MSSGKPMKRTVDQMEKDLNSSTFDAEVDARVAVMQAELDALCSEMKSTVTLELTRLPPRVRNMKAREFFETYHGDIVEALRNGGASSIMNTTTATSK